MPANGHNHTGMPAFGQKGQGEHQPAEVYVFMVFLYGQHGQHSQREEQKIDGIRVTCPGQMGRQWSFIGAEKAQYQKRGLFAVTPGEQGAGDSGQQIGKRGCKSQAKDTVAKELNPSTMPQ